MAATGLSILGVRDRRSSSCYSRTFKISNRIPGCFLHELSARWQSFSLPLCDTVQKNTGCECWTYVVLNQLSIGCVVNWYSREIIFVFTSDVLFESVHWLPNRPCRSRIRWRTLVTRSLALKNANDANVGPASVWTVFRKHRHILCYRKDAVQDAITLGPTYA